MPVPLPPPSQVKKKKKKRGEGGRKKGGWHWYPGTTVTTGCSNLTHSSGEPMRKAHSHRRSERSIQESIRRALEADGWLVEKTHGNKFQPGWPDLYCFRLVIKMTGKQLSYHRWVEVKRPGGKLTPAQVHRFTKWEAHGLHVWVLTSVDLDVLFGQPNWRAFVKTKGGLLLKNVQVISDGVGFRRGSVPVVRSSRRVQRGIPLPPPTVIRKLHLPPPVKRPRGRGKS